MTDASIVEDLLSRPVEALESFGWRVAGIQLYSSGRGWVGRVLVMSPAEQSL